MTYTKMDFKVWNRKGLKVKTFATISGLLALFFLVIATTAILKDDGRAITNALIALVYAVLSAGCSITAAIENKK